MIIVRLTGGLGNQMFQYALALHLALSKNTSVKFDMNVLLDRTPVENAVFRNFDLGIFGIEEIRASQKEIDYFLFKPKKPLNKAMFLLRNILNPYIVLSEENFRFNENVFNINSSNIFLNGNWQSEKYFKPIEKKIREAFVVRAPYKDEIFNLAENISECNSVCLNVRRGDYMLPENIKKFGIFGLDYYKKALEIISEKTRDLRVFVFSDDVAWCEENLKFDFPTFYVTHNFAGHKFSSYLKLMMLCKHFVIPNSTFAWWAAWLCTNPSKIIVAPDKWFANDEIDYRDVVPENWIKI